MNKSQATDAYPELEALNKPPKKLVVLLHGVGADGYDLISLAPLMQRDLPNCHFISPHGVEPFDMAPFGRQWFSLLNLDPMVIRELVINTAPQISSIIKEKQLLLNLTNKDTIIIGFSQGTMIGLYLNLIQKDPFDAVIGFSGLLIPPDKCLNTKTPICLIHGEEDSVVSISEMHRAIKYLQKHNIKYVSHKIPNLAHSIDSQCIDLAVEFITSN